MIGVSEKALSICDEHYTEDHRHSGCQKCPIFESCRIKTRLDNEGMILWRDGINEAAERVAP